MGILGRKTVKHNPWFVFSLWVILIAIGMLEAWAILLRGKDYPTWQYVLCLIGILFVGASWLYRMFASAKKNKLREAEKSISSKKTEKDPKQLLLL